MECQPIAGRSKVVAEWYDIGGKPTGEAADRRLGQLHPDDARHAG